MGRCYLSEGWIRRNLRNASTVNEFGLTQEEMNAIWAENETVGKGLSVAPEIHHTGEDTSDFNKYN